MKPESVINKSVVKTVIAALLMAFVVNCVSTMGMTSSTTPLEGKKYDVVGKAEGESNYSWAILGLWGFGNPDVDKAIKDAVKKKDGDALINVRWYNKTYYFVLFSLDKVTVEGDVVRFRNENTGKRRKNRGR